VPDEYWIDLIDPDEDALRAALPVDIHEVAMAALLRAPRPNDEPRPRLEAHGAYVLGILAFPHAANGGVLFQEVDIIATPETLLTVRKSPPGTPACDLGEVREGALRRGEAPGLSLYRIVDEIAERFLDLIDQFDDAINVLEDHVTEWERDKIRRRISSLRHDLLHLPTFIVGLYGQNFFHMPELRWEYGYLWSWALILVTTALQLWFYRRKRWI
jgi:Mg2+ and Co2+ transporter CorA